MTFAYGVSMPGAWGIAALLTVSLGCRQPGPPSDSYPRKPIKVIVPFDAGGGSDTFTRIVQQAIDEHALLPQPLVVINVPGAGGTIGSRRVMNARPDGYTVLQLHEGILTSKYAGNVEFGPEAFEAVAGTGSMAHVITVRDDSAFQDVGDLVRAAGDRPDSIVFAVGIGAPSHFSGLMLENAHDQAKFRFTQTGGGAKRFASLLGGHSDVTTFSVAEFMEFRLSGLRALAILTETRHPAAPGVPTAKEQGLDVVSTNMHFWWVPKGTPRDRIDTLANALQRAMQTRDVTTRLRDLLTDPVVLVNEDLRADLQKRERLAAAVALRRGAALPDFPLFVLGVCVVLGIVAAHNHRPSIAEPSRPTQFAVPAAIIASTLLYVGSMQLDLLGFRVATLAFVLGTGGLLCRRSRQRPRRSLLLAVFVVAILLSFGLHALFTQVFVIDLPS